MNGSPSEPLEIREGETEIFYLVWDEILDTSETISTSDFVGPSTVTITAESINVGVMVIGGVTYAIGKVAYFTLADCDEGETVEIVDTITTSAGRTLKQSLWIRCVKNY